MVTVELSWPGRVLWANRSKGRHWAATADAVATARNEARIVTLAALAGDPFMATDRAALVVTFYPPDRRRRDLMNVYQAIKAQQDGIADALRIDDAAFCPVTLMWGKPEKPGRVVVQIGAG